MVELEELRNFNATNLYDKLINLNNDEFEEWLAEKKLIYNSRVCPDCGGRMSHQWITDREHPTKSELGIVLCA
jgi:hypothetical protein